MRELEIVPNKLFSPFSVEERRTLSASSHTYVQYPRPINPFLSLLQRIFRNTPLLPDSSLYLSLRQSCWSASLCCSSCRNGLQATPSISIGNASKRNAATWCSTLVGCKENAVSTMSVRPVAIALDLLR
jgi:hypothetical protein